MYTNVKSKVSNWPKHVPYVRSCVQSPKVKNKKKSKSNQNKTIIYIHRVTRTRNLIHTQNLNPQPHNLSNGNSWRSNPIISELYRDRKSRSICCWRTQQERGLLSFVNHAYKCYIVCVWFVFLFHVNYVRIETCVLFIWCLMLFCFCRIFYYNLYGLYVFDQDVDWCLKFVLGC